MFNIRISTAIHLLSVRYNKSENCVNCNNRHNINVCCIEPAQICIFSHIGRNLSVFLNNNVKYKLFLRQTILTDCQIRNSARLVWSVLGQTACRMVTSYATQAYRQSAHSLTAQVSTHSIRHSTVYSNSRHGQTA